MDAGSPRFRSLRLTARDLAFALMASAVAASLDYGPRAANWPPHRRIGTPKRLKRGRVAPKLVGAKGLRP